MSDSFSFQSLICRLVIWILIQLFLEIKTLQMDINLQGWPTKFYILSVPLISECSWNLKSEMEPMLPSAWSWGGDTGAVLKLWQLGRAHDSYRPRRIFRDVRGGSREGRIWWWGVRQVFWSFLFQTWVCQWKTACVFLVTAPQSWVVFVAPLRSEAQ